MLEVFGFTATVEEQGAVKGAREDKYKGSGVPPLLYPAQAKYSVS